MDIFCDGSCRGNGTWYAEAKAYVYIKGETLEYEVPGKQTNQRAEIFALVKALELSRKGDRIFSDSEYAVNLAAGIYKPKANRDLVDKLITLYEKKRKYGVKISWISREGNLADPGNR